MLKRERNWNALVVIYLLAILGALVLGLFFEWEWSAGCLWVALIVLHLLYNPYLQRRR